MAANSVVPTPELQISTEKKAEETIVHGSGRITTATSDLLHREQFAGSSREPSALCSIWRRSTTSAQFWPRCFGQCLSGRDQSTVCSGFGESEATD